MRLHHVTLFVRDTDRSTRFYRDGLGLSVFVDREFDGDWPTLFGVTATRLRAVILGDADSPDSGRVELVSFPEPIASGAAPGPVTASTAMLSFVVDLDAVLPAVERLGGSDVRHTTLRNGYGAATVRDPDGVLVELLGTRREPGAT